MGLKYIHIGDPLAVKADLITQCKGITWIERALELAWEDYKLSGWIYDGATFVREHNDNYWEVAAFIHDWMNHIGHVGKDVDLYFINIMISLKYPTRIIFERCKWMQWTLFNVFYHKYIKRDFVSTGVPEILKFNV